MTTLRDYAHVRAKNRPPPTEPPDGPFTGEVLHERRGMVWRGPIAAFMRDQSPEIDIEGALSCGKTTGCLHKVRKLTYQYPGIHGYIGRFSDGEVSSLLCPAWELCCQRVGEMPSWNAEEKYYEFKNKSRVYAFGLKSPDFLSRYAKLRGLEVSFFYVDQAEELPHDFVGEIRARQRQGGYPHQLIFSPNPPNPGHWLTTEFPESAVKRLPGRNLYSLSLYDNAHNLPKETILGIEASWPPEHAKYRSLVMGKRGLNVIGKPVYGGMFKRGVHVRPLQYDPHSILYESYDFGKHHPCVLFAQTPYYGGLHVLGGIMGTGESTLVEGMFLEDFIPLAKQYRADWFPEVAAIRSCCDPAGTHYNSQGTRYTGLSILKQEGINPIWRENSNAPDVRIAVIDRVAGHMRRRTAGGTEAFGVNDDPEMWLRVSSDGPVNDQFLADGCEAGYVWSAHEVSVGSKKVRVPKKDGWFEHGQNCLEYLELNFGADKPTQEDEDKRAERRRRRAQETRERGDGRRGWMAS